MVFSLPPPSSKLWVLVQRGAWGGTQPPQLLPLAHRGSGPPRLDGGRPPRSRFPRACRVRPAASLLYGGTLGLCASTCVPRWPSRAGRIGRTHPTAPRCRRSCPPLRSSSLGGGDC